jgi:hypothetical protein
MPGYVKLERWKVVEYRDGATYKTKRVGYMWFPISEQPECYVVDAEHHLWATGDDFYFGNQPPECGVLIADNGAKTT